MTVTSVEELNRLVGEGWTPYYHKAVRRWYLRRGKDVRIIGAQLEPYVEDLAAGIPRKRNKVTPEVAAQVVRLRQVPHIRVE